MFFLENHQDNFITFEIEPKETEQEDDIEATIQYHVENTNTSNGLVTKTVMRVCTFTITAEQVCWIYILYYVYYVIIYIIL